MKKISVFLVPFLLACAAAGVCEQQPTAQQQPPQKDSSHESEFFQEATNGAIFIYSPLVNPCAPVPKGKILLPLGSAFVTGVEKRGASTPQLWSGWKFLVTAKHVLLNQSEIIVRVNAESASKFVCKTIHLETEGQARNVFLAPEGVDLEAVAIPNIPGADPTVVTPSLLVDEAKMKESNIGVGTQVLTIGYLFGYSGEQANFPVAKFGHISIVTDELWYFNPESKLMERGYVLDLSNAPGLSGAPVYTHGVEIETDPLRYRRLPPYLVGVVKGLMLVPVNGQMISQGVAIIEPGANLKVLMLQIAAMLKSNGADVVPIN